MSKALKVELPKGFTNVVITPSNNITANTGDSADWDTLMAKATETSWKDEYWTIVLSIPAILCFVPGMVEHVRAGFDALGGMPGWYQWMLGIAVGAAFGYRKIADFMSLKKGS